MSVDIFFRTNDALDPSDPKYENYGRKRGDLCLVREAREDWSSFRKMVDGRFLRVRITDADRGEFNHYAKYWSLKSRFNVIASDLSVDGHRVRIEGTEYHSDGRGKITRQMVENYLDGWNATGITTGDNQVTFDILIFDAIKSPRFWGVRSVLSLGFSEIHYEESTGVHAVRVDYSGLDLSTPERREAVKRRVASRMTNIIHDEANNAVTGDIDRETVREFFFEDVRQSLNKIEYIYARHRFRIPEAVCQVIENNGGVLVRTKAQVISYIRDRTRG